MGSIYRKSSLEKLSSPEQLDHMIHVTSSLGWLALLGMLIMVIAAVYWGFFGELSEKVEVKGVYISTGEGNVEKQSTLVNTQDEDRVSMGILCYVPLSTGKKILTGMKVNVVPSTVNELEAGYMLGTVKKVGTYGTSEEDMLDKLGDELLVQAFRQQKGSLEPVIEVEIELNQDENTRSRYEWSNEKGEDIVIPDFTMVDAYIITDTQYPVQKFISSIN
ncbi:MAG: hypothetical protein WCD89_03560 [Anaerocolumna sp.]